MKQKFNIIGMSCSACSSRITKVLQQAQGVINVNVDLLKNKAYVEYDETVITNDDIIAIVKKAGYDASLIDEVSKSNPLKKRLIISAILLIPLLYLSMKSMLHLPTFPLIENVIVNYSLQLVIALAIVIVNYRYFTVGYKMLWNKAPNMDSLIAISTSAAFIYGVYVLIMVIVNPNDVTNMVYFESVGMVLTLVTVGKFLEGNSKKKTTEAITKLIANAPDKACIIRAGVEEIIDVKDVLVDDLLVVKEGEAIPVDGIIISGHGIIDEAVITGEAMYVEKGVNDEVLASTVNHGGYFTMKATRVGVDTTYDKIIQLVDEASTSKAKVSRIADKVSGIFVPLVITIAIVVFIIWMIITNDPSLSISIAIACLVVSCPCALGLATPTAIMVATLRSATNHSLIKNAEALEVMAKVNYVLLDKTGTITTGKPEVVEVKPYNIAKDEFYSIVNAIESLSNHPLAKAIIKSTTNEKIYLAVDYQNILGRGITATINGEVALAGNNRLFADYTIEIPDQEINSNAIYFGYANTYIGSIIIDDVIKPTSQIAIDELRKLNIDIAIVSGDSKERVERVSKKLNIAQFYYETLPVDKDNIVKSLQEQGKVVAFIGDGVNDSIALTRADVSIAIGAGTDVALSSASVILARNELADAVDTIRLSRKTMRIIKENLFWAFFYNIILIPIAAGVLSPLGIILKPSYAAIAMSISSITVVLNALRINKFKSICKNIPDNCYTKGGDCKLTNYSISVKIEGMMCDHCRSRIEKNLQNIPNLSVKVDLASKTAYIESSEPINEKEIRSIISNAGYTVVEINQN